MHKTQPNITQRVAMAMAEIWRRKSREFPGLIYGIKPDGFDYLKVGYCRDNYDRLKTLQVAWPVELEYVFLMQGDRHLESIIHGALWPSHARGDWFQYGLLVDLFLKRLFEDFPSAKPKQIQPHPKPVCDHFVVQHGWKCEKCGLSALLIPASPSSPAEPPTQEKGIEGWTSPHMRN